MASWIIFVCLVAIVSADDMPFEGACPDFGPMKGFNVMGMLGKWYCVYGEKVGLPDEDIRCVTNYYTLSLSGLHVQLNQTSNVNNTYRIIEVPSRVLGSPLVPNARLEGEMAEESKPVTIDFTLLYSDYNDCTVTVLCYSNGTNYGYGVQIYSREPTLTDQECINNAHKVLQQRRIPWQMQPVVQDCGVTPDDDLTKFGKGIGNLADTWHSILPF